MNLHELLELVREGRGRYDGGEAVDDLAHALQAAALARADGAPAELVAAALLHDIGHHPTLVELHPQTPHERVGALVLEPVLGERVAWVVGAHVEAKRHLSATDTDYVRSLSSSSMASLAQQGGPKAMEHFTTGWGPDALALRRWDDGAKVRGAAEPQLEELIAGFGWADVL